MKKALTIVSVVALAAMAQAGYIFNWSVDSSVGNSVYDYAYIFSGSDTQSGTQLYAADVTSGTKLDAYSTFYYGDLYSTAYSDTEITSYYYQFVKGSTSSFSDVFTAGSTGKASVDGNGLMVGSSVANNAPEPTSALLMMLGMSLLALKRKVA